MEKFLSFHGIGISILVTLLLINSFIVVGVVESSPIVSGEKNEIETKL